jgi:hypothetical protein
LLGLDETDNSPNQLIIEIEKLWLKLYQYSSHEGNSDLHRRVQHDFLVGHTDELDIRILEKGRGLGSLETVAANCLLTGISFTTTSKSQNAPGNQHEFTHSPMR